MTHLFWFLALLWPAVFPNFMLLIVLSLTYQTLGIQVSAVNEGESEGLICSWRSTYLEYTVYIYIAMHTLTDTNAGSLTVGWIFDLIIDGAKNNKTTKATRQSLLFLNDITLLLFLTPLPVSPTAGTKRWRSPPSRHCVGPSVRWVTKTNKDNTFFKCQPVHSYAVRIDRAAMRWTLIG